MVSGLMLANSGTGSGTVRELQSLDALGQSLEALAQFLDSAAAGMSPDWRLDPAKAASMLKLRGLAMRLASPTGAAVRPGDNNHCVFF